MLRREYQSSCVCVSPGGPPEGILDVAEYIVCRVVFFLFVLVFYPSTIFFRRSCKFFGEKTNVAFFFVVVDALSTTNARYIPSAYFIENIYITKVLYDEVRFARMHAHAYCFSFCSSSECTFPNGIPFTLGSTYSAAISFTFGKKSSS